MKHTLSRAITLSLVLVIVGGCLALAVVRLSQKATCMSPVFLASYHGPGASSMRALIQNMGGLPKSNAELEDSTTLPSSVQINPVASWEMEKLRVHRWRPLWEDIRDDDPNYGVAADFRVQYADGSSGILRWDTWQYGLALCPVVIGLGSGPPGKIEVLELGNR